MPTLSELYGLTEPDAQPQRPAGGSEFGKGFKRSFAELPGLAAGVGAYAADVVGATDTRDSLLNYAQRKQQETEQNYGSDAASFSNVMEGKASPTDFLANAAGYVLGQATQAIASGGLTALGFKALAKASATQAAKVATERALAQGLATDAAQQVGLDAAKEVLTRSAIQGATAGAGAHNLGMELGSIYPDAVEEAQKQGTELDGGDKLRVGLSALAAAAVDTAMERVTAGKWLKGTPGESILARARREVPLGMAREGSTEAIQTGIEHYGAGQPIADEKGLRDIIDSAAVGAVGGGLAGGGASLHRQSEELAAPAPSTSDQGLSELATATTAGEAINAAYKAADVPLAPVGLSETQAARGLDALDRQAQDDLDAIKQAGRMMPMDEQRRGPSPAPAVEMPEPTVTDAPFLDRLLTLREQVQDPQVREQVRSAFGPDALRQVLYSLNIADRPDKLPEDRRDKVLAAAELIVSRAIAQPLDTAAPAPSARREAAGPALTAPAPLPRIGLDTSPTGTVRVDSAGNAAPETRADAISTKQRVDAMRKRPDGFEQQVTGRPLPRDFTLVGDGTLTPGVIERPAPAQLPAPPNKPGKRGAFEAAERERAAAEAAKPDQMEAIAAVKRAGESPAPTALAAAMRTALDRDAHAAATSPTNDRPEPTQAQKEAGNYAKGHIKVGGLDISVENPAGSTRKGVDESGKAWENQLEHHYGYIRRTTGADGEHVDVFVKPGTPEDYSGPVFVVDQVNPASGKFDEHKVVIGATDRADAEAIYRANYAPDWKGLKSIRGMTMPGFKKWLQGDTTKPVGTLKDQVEATRRQPAGLLPVEKLGELAQLTQRPREDVAKQYTGFVQQHGKERADAMLDRALEVARENPKPPPEPEAATKPAEPPKPPAPNTKAEPSPPAEAKKEPSDEQGRLQGRRQEEALTTKTEPAAAPTSEPATTERSADDVDHQAKDVGPAQGLASGARPTELIALRKQHAALKALSKCLMGGA